MKYKNYIKLLNKKWEMVISELNILDKLINDTSQRFFIYRRPFNRGKGIRVNEVFYKWADVKMLSMEEKYGLLLQFDGGNVVIPTLNIEEIKIVYD